MDEANRLYLQYLKFVPDDPKVLFNMGTMRMRRASNESNPALKNQIASESLNYFMGVLGSPHPDFETKAHAANNAGLVVANLGQPEKAKQLFDGAQFYLPGYRAPRVNGADVLIFQGEYEKADRILSDIIASDLELAGPQFCRGLIALAHGDFRRGWLDYRARFYMRSFKSKMVETDRPLWDGEDLAGKTLLISTEQGWGDAIQFIRYADVVKAAHPQSRIVFAIDGSMHSLLRGVRGLDAVVPDHLTDEFKALALEFDYHVPLMHLPDICGTTLETIPAQCPYIHPQEDWINLPLNPTDKKKIGIVWAGSPIHGKDRFRSMLPSQFQRFIDAAPHCQFYSLQCGPRAHEAESLRNCIDLAPLIHEWTQTATAIQQMDLVVCVDTAVAHLAGALGVPAWILLPSSPDFRWMLGRSDSPWYPCARLFRQSLRNDWESVIEQVREELRKL